jgi:aspartate/glutamate racemase
MKNAAPRIALVHALTHSLAPINDALNRDWPEATRMNVLDDSLSADLARAGQLDDAMTARFQAVGDYALATGAQGILFTCSAFGPCIDAVARKHAGVPVLKPNEAMIEEAVAFVAQHGGKVGLVSSFMPTLQSMPREFPATTPLLTAFAPGAMDALNRGDFATHDAATVQAAKGLAAQGCTVIALAQFSMARAAGVVAAATGLPVLTTVDSAVRKLKALLGH